MRGGKTIYDRSLGIMMMDTQFPRVLGDVGNAATWPFPVRYRVVEGAVVDRLARPDPDLALLDPFLTCVRELEADGVAAIITSCGYLAVHQRQLAEAVSVPVFASSLLQVPLAARTVRPGRTIGIITARAVLSEQYFLGAGWSSSDIPVVQMAPDDDSCFVRTLIPDTRETDPALIYREMGELAGRLVAEHPDVAAIVLECANFAPFAPSVRRATGLPVFDLYTLGILAHLAGTGVGEMGG